MEQPTFTAHVLDTTRGVPAENISVSVFKLSTSSGTLTQEQLATAITNSNGRVGQWNVPLKEVESGVYKFRFDTGPYYDAMSVETFYPYVELTVQIKKGQHYHIPLLLSPFGFTTYRGS
ncbi:transthyretin [Schizosaccharomyces cryophilus OY26]|uniref:5-hydroxyisourate hydrolase n=1 Tax=Schizosaccharomyces cryophilus (strain OY26 / ATCC MYA-4695 / CBS 11777 / NBRC 106824 / NRRL Y48691) TaxID=653667 RepID=S9W0T7_SCHCR|nr:transthyretin [Schizosaccharomyces cryophilus OY26]EPY52034.1 transthyretin [Schizosaccharomyces cryophilus OY26]